VIINEKLNIRILINLSMSENKTNLGDILGNVIEGVMGTTAPMMTGLVKSMLSPGMIKSVTGMILDMLGAVVEAISSIDLGEILSSTLGAILPVAMKLLDPLLDILGPIIEALLDMLTPVLEIVGPLLEAIGPLMESLKNIVDQMIGALTGSSA
jgi:phage-related protein